jgi:hypothetical protein
MALPPLPTERASHGGQHKPVVVRNEYPRCVQRRSPFPARSTAFTVNVFSPLAVP